MSKHGYRIPRGGSMKEMAKEISNLRYDALCEFFDELRTKLTEDALADELRGRHKLSAHLQAASGFVNRAGLEFSKAWDICEPFMGPIKSGITTKFLMIGPNKWWYVQEEKGCPTDKWCTSKQYYKIYQKWTDGCRCISGD